jgi:hypothetical protein
LASNGCHAAIGRCFIAGDGASEMQRNMAILNSKFDGSETLASKSSVKY